VTIRALWKMGWDTARIANYIDERRHVYDNGCWPLARDVRISEQDVYNVLDRALGRTESVTVKAS
jgi:hypothetical protein